MVHILGTHKRVADPKYYPYPYPDRLEWKISNANILCVEVNRYGCGIGNLGIGSVSELWMNHRVVVNFMNMLICNVIVDTNGSY